MRDTERASRAGPPAVVDEPGGRLMPGPSGCCTRCRDRAWGVARPPGGSRPRHWAEGRLVGLGDASRPGGVYWARRSGQEQTREAAQVL